MPVIEIDSLTKRYGAARGVEELRLRVPKGVMYGFLGPNGCGKTTTIRVLMGFLKATRGSARILDQDCWRQAAAIKSAVGYLPGDLRLPSWLSCREGLHLFGAIRGRDLIASGLGLANEFDLPPDQRAGVMSRGTRQKLGLVLAMAHRPRLLILDEPTASLDPLMQERLYARLRGFVREGGTVLLSSHTLSEVEHLCDHVAVLRQGRLVADASLAELRDRAPRRVTVRWQAKGAASDTRCGVEWSEREDHRWEGLLRGPVTELIRWAAGQPIADLVVEAPDLREIFRQLYL